MLGVGKQTPPNNGTRKFAFYATLIYPSNTTETTNSRRVVININKDIVALLLLTAVSALHRHASVAALGFERDPKAAVYLQKRATCDWLP